MYNIHCMIQYFKQNYLFSNFIESHFLNLEFVLLVVATAVIVAIAMIVSSTVAIAIIGKLHVIINIACFCCTPGFHSGFLSGNTNFRTLHMHIVVSCGMLWGVSSYYMHFFMTDKAMMNPAKLPEYH